LANHDRFDFIESVMVVNMEQIPCIYCGDFFEPSPRHKNQTACKKESCRKAKKAVWQRYKLKHDPVYRANQKSSQQQWLAATPGYWKAYRKKHPEKAERKDPSAATQPQSALFAGGCSDGRAADCKDGSVKIG